MPSSKKWWKNGAVYQIYPASFADSNGDGIGDLGGILYRLGYIQSLGVKTVYLCPIYQSPQVDMGYDISDYESIHEPYGSLEQMTTLIHRIHGYGMRIMLDLVINHTSDQHKWFLESRSSRDSPKRDWYIWRPPRYSPDGTRLPPNNWRSNFGAGSAWEWDEATGEYYLHLFAKEQPDLNWENPETRQAIYKSAMEFWLERGVDGFRVDAVNMYSKPPGLPDAPITDPNSPYQPAGKVYCNGPRMHEYLSEMREILDKYNAIAVGELPHTPDMSQVLSYVSARAGQLDAVLQFDLVDLGKGTTHHYETTPKNWTLKDFKIAVGRIQGVMRGTDGWTTTFLENHDQARSVSRFGDERPQFIWASTRILIMAQCCFSGTIFIFQGQELGFVNAPLSMYPVELYLDIESKLFLKKVRDEGGDMDKAKVALQHLARDHARIPMAWDGKAPYAGFSESSRMPYDQVAAPWMAPHPLAPEMDMKSIIDKSLSPFKFWSCMLRRREKYADYMIHGTYQVVRFEHPELFIFTKSSRGGRDKMLVILNFSTNDHPCPVFTSEELELWENGPVELTPLLSTHWSGKMPEGVSADVPLRPYEGRMYLVNHKE